jgi:hypothetical protein
MKNKWRIALKTWSLGVKIEYEREKIKRIKEKTINAKPVVCTLYALSKNGKGIKTSWTSPWKPLVGHKPPHTCRINNTASICTLMCAMHLLAILFY